MATKDWPVEVCPGGGLVTTTLVRSMNYLYLDDLPIAVTEQKAGASVPSLYYVETDHLGTPRVVAEPSTNAVKWPWDFFGNVFGEHAPTMPAGGVALNMRYPGQFFDVETGLSYNYFRDYEPRIGRHVEPDPTGLSGGNAMFAYVGGSPLRMIDLFGLCEEVKKCRPGIPGHIKNREYRSQFKECCAARLYCYPSSAFGRMQKSNIEAWLLGFGEPRHERRD